MLVLALLRVLVVETFAVVSDSMEPTLQDGDRLVVLKTTSIDRGDLIVLDGEHLLGARDLGRNPVGDALARLVGADPQTAYVKRVIGVPGDHVVCCGDDDRLVINGESAAEPYLDGPTDQTRFDVIVPANRYWVLGDNRRDSADSRSALGRPGGGMLRADDVIGEVSWRYWPTDRLGAVPGTGPAHTASAFGSDARAQSAVGDTSGVTAHHVSKESP